MLQIHKLKFIEMCRKNGKSLEECFACVVDNSNNIWSIDENNPVFPEYKEVEQKTEDSSFVYKTSEQLPFSFLKKL